MLRRGRIRTMPSVSISHVGLIILILLVQACASPPLPTSEPTIIPTSTEPPTATRTATATSRPAEATLTEFARQAEGTRQVLADTQVALEQNANATATSRAL